MNINDFKTVRKPRKTFFFTFSQNNSGGKFQRVAGKINEYVIIEAHDTEEANKRAEEIGIYFDGVNMGWDCGCCGDRWTRIWEDGEGTAEPMIYDEPASLYSKNVVIHPLS
jgi:hypothetical protein